MSDNSPQLARLFERAVVRLSPTDDSENVAEFLQGLVTNDVTAALPAYAALLSAQGKTMFDFLVWPGDAGSLLIDWRGLVTAPLSRLIKWLAMR